MIKHKHLDNKNNHKTFPSNHHNMSSSEKSPKWQNYYYTPNTYIATSTTKNRMDSKYEYCITGTYFTKYCQSHFIFGYCK